MVQTGIFYPNLGALGAVSQYLLVGTQNRKIFWKYNVPLQKNVFGRFVTHIGGKL